MIWHFSVKAYIIALYYFILDFATSLRALISPNNSCDLYIELPVTSRPPSNSHIAHYRAFIQRFILTPLTTWYLAVHIFIHKLCYTISWNYPIYLQRIENALRATRAATLKGLGGPCCRVKSSSRSPEAHAHQLSRCIIEDFQVPMRPHAYMHVPSVPSKSEPNFGRAVSDETAMHAIEVELIEPLSDRIESPTLSSSYDSASSSQPSLTTPYHSPGQDDFDPTIVSTNGEDEVNIAEFRVKNAFSVDATTVSKGFYTDHYAKYPGSKTSSINSFGQIERLFESTYGSPVSAAIEELLESLNKFCISPPDHIAVYSARICYDVSTRSSDTYSPDSSISMDTIRQNDVFEEQDITSAIRSPENLGQELVDISFSDDGTRSEADLTISNLASFSSDLALEADTSPSARSDVLASLDHSILAMEEILSTAFEQEIQLTESSLVSSRHGAPSPERIFTSVSSENSSAQSSVVSTPTDTLPVSSQDLSERKKSENRSARVTTGLAIDIERLTSMISLGSDSSDVLDDVTITAGPVHEPAESEKWTAALRCVPIPSIIVSSASENASPALPTSILKSSSATQSEPQDLFVGPRNEGSPRYNPPRLSDFSGKPRATHTSIAHTSIITNNSTTTANPTHHSYGATPPLPPSSTINDLSSRRVGLRGRAPRYRFATVLPENKSLDLRPDARAHLGEPSSRRVGLYGALPRQRFSSTNDGAGSQMHVPTNAKGSFVVQMGAVSHNQTPTQPVEKNKEVEALVAAAERERTVVFERHRARALFFAQRDMHSGPGLRPLLLPLQVAARNSGAAPAAARSWGLPF